MVKKRLATGSALLLAGALCGCGTLQTTAPTGSPSPIATSSASPTVSGSPPASNPTLAGFVETVAAGALRGDFALLLRRVVDGSAEKHEIWLIALDRSRATMVIRYTPSAGGPINQLGSISRNLARSTSPDGARILVSVQLANSQSLVAVTLATGMAAALAPDPQFTDVEAAWHPGGSTIAVSRAPSSDQRRRELWVGGADGTGWHRVHAGPISTLYGFTPDGSAVCFAVLEITCVSATTGNATVTYQGQASADVAASSRKGQLGFAGALRDATGGRLDVADMTGPGQRTVVRALALDPRWRPGADEILYRVDTSLFVARIDGQTRRLPTDGAVRRAEWAPDGQEVLFIAADSAVTPIPPAPPPETTLRAIRSDGSAQREVFRPPNDGRSLGLAEVTAIRY